MPDAIKTDHDTLDIRDADYVKHFVDNNKIETIVNCAAYTAVDKAKIKKTFGIEIPHWRKSLQDCLQKIRD